MEKNKLFELLSTFAPKEFENFGIFLDSPYLNSSALARTFYNLFSKYYPEFDNKALEKEKLFEKLYPGEAFRDKRMRDIYSKTLELAENYIGYLKLKTDAPLLCRNSLSELARRGLDKHFEQKARELEKMVLKTKIKDSAFFYNLYALSKQRREHYETKEMLGKREEYFADENVEIHYFILYFASNMLEYYMTIQIQTKLLKYRVDSQMLEEVIKFLESKDISAYPQIQAMYLALSLVRNKDTDEAYHKLKKLLLERKDEIDLVVLKACYVNLYNFTKERALKTDPVHVKENFELLKHLMENRLHPTEAGFMNAQTYIVVVGEGLIHQEFDWTRKFLEDFKNEVSPDRRENAYMLGKALLEYRLGHFDTALDLLAKVKTEDFYYTIRVKNHQIKINFEIERYELAQSIAVSFRRFLNTNDTIPDYIKNRFTEFCSFIDKLVNAIFDNDRIQMAMLKKGIQEVNEVENRKWMLERINKLL